jgi:hypothetical protein
VTSWEVWYGEPKADSIVSLEVGRYIFLIKKIKRQGLARGSNLEQFLAKVDVKHKQPNMEMRKSRKNGKKALKRSFVRQSRSRNAVDDMSS